MRQVVEMNRIYKTSSVFLTVREELQRFVL